MIPVVPSPAIAFARTAAERDDQALAWARDDRAFFAAGACHILAFRFVERRADDRFRPVLVQPRPDGMPGSHVFATDGTWAFDFNGWSLEADLLAANVAACRAAFPGWTHELLDLAGRTLAEACEAHHHRRPEHFAHLPWDRADAYLDRFPPEPP